MGTALRYILGDQLSPEIATLRDLDRARDVVLMVEVATEATYIRHHPKKIALIFAAMRHFAAALRDAGVRVTYVRLDDSENTGSFRGELSRAVARHDPERIVVTEPGAWRVWSDMQDWEQLVGLPVEIRADDRFFVTPAAFARWASGRKTLRMETFYRAQRRATGILMTPEGQPEGGQWNLDAANRKALPAAVTPPGRCGFAPDAMTREVLDLVSAHFGHHFGTLEGFDFAVTPEQARQALVRFIDAALPFFGDYQDAMRAGDPLLFHSRLSAYLNLGLLDPRQVCAEAEAAWRDARAPLNAVEGFIRQILGWREFVRGVYWLKMPDYAVTNVLEATRPLPAFYWTGETEMACLRDVVTQTRAEAYAHHIQRLMVTGNFALLAGLDPVAVNEWYMVVYADAFEWVELPNVQGMALFADGGVFASKPYAASGKYIDRMSNYCRHCRYDPRKQLTSDACPFNALYWRFLDRHRDRFERNPRMSLPLKTLERMTPEKRAALRAKATDFLESLDPAVPGQW